MPVPARYLYIMKSFKTFFLPVLLLSVFLISACGDDEEVTNVLPERIIGTWVRTGFVIDCEGEDEDEIFEFTCDAENCRQIIFGSDSTFTTINTADSVSIVTNEFYLFTADVITGEIDNTIEICDGTEFNRECNEEFEVSIEGNMLRLSVLDEENCLNTQEYIRSE